MSTLIQQPYIIARLVDASASRAEIRLHVKRGTSRAAGLAAAGQLATLCDGASACSAEAYLLRYPVVLTPTGNPLPGANVRRVGVLVFETVDPAQFALVEIPGIRPNLIDPTDETILLPEAPALKAYVTAIIDNGLCNPFGYQITKLVAALFQFRQN